MRDSDFFIFFSPKTWFCKLTLLFVARLFQIKYNLLLFFLIFLIALVAYPFVWYCCHLDSNASLHREKLLIPEVVKIPRIRGWCQKKTYIDKNIFKPCSTFQTLCTACSINSILSQEKKDTPVKIIRINGKWRDIPGFLILCTIKKYLSCLSFQY